MFGNETHFNVNEKIKGSFFIIQLISGSIKATQKLCNDSKLKTETKNRCTSDSFMNEIRMEESPRNFVPAPEESKANLNHKSFILPTQELPDFYLIAANPLRSTYKRIGWGGK